jgi:ethanolamine transporter
MWRIPNGMIKGFTVFGKFVVIVATAALALAIVDELTGITIIRGMDSVNEGIAVVGSIVIVLAGAYPMVNIIVKAFSKPLASAGKLLGVNDVAVGWLVASLANNIPMLGMAKDMDIKGKVINFAFMVSGAFVFGDHLGFTAGVAKHMVLPNVVGKLTAAITAVVLAIFVTNLRYKNVIAVKAEAK